MSKHTKGPWTVRVTGPHHNNPDLQNIEINFGDDCECVCDTVYEIEDANLISAAPDMLAALELIAEWIELDHYGHRLYGPVYAAIKKDKGE